MSSLFNNFLFLPLFNLLIFFYDLVPDIGVAIILLTIFVRLILYPLSQKALKSQREMTLLQPKIKEIQKNFKESKEEQSRALLNLYREHRVNPFSGFLTILIQIPVLFALLKVFRVGLDQSSLNFLYDFVKNPGQINPLFLGFIDLSQTRNIALAALAGVSQFWQSKMMLPKDQKTTSPGDLSNILNKQMVYVFPALIGFISLSWPAAIALYWTTFNLFAILQQYLSLRFPYKEKHVNNQNLESKIQKN
ncbi:MAG: membrane protein insertase YidC [Parcubacteria group bacterium]|nr:membrane protein insertase YidC [Parcubacteria group bacterium]